MARPAGADQGLLNSFFGGWATADIHTHLPFVYNLSSGCTYTYGPAFQRFGSCAKVVRFPGPAKPWLSQCSPQAGSALQDGVGPAGRHQLPFLGLWWQIYRRSILPLYEGLRPQAGAPSPAPTVCLSGVGVPRENSAHNGEGRCVNPGTVSSQPWPTEDASDRTSVADRAPPSPKRCHVKDVDLAAPVAALSLQERARAPSPEAGRRQWEEGRIDYLGKDAFTRIQEKLDRFLQ
ncbi:Glycogenin-2 [Galemys pyrenaicus]|uniref:Glycogenin-2 n=1 Tax=Galemys pyrenaicus TaxID=202257 RepID=A0A8J6A7S4_GALPY|nr:Glycogenin-2 [Galemys pyrenaicus]